MKATAKLITDDGTIGTIGMITLVRVRMNSDVVEFRGEGQFNARLSFLEQLAARIVSLVLRDP